jgi:Hemerythrin HHE cation binding domain
MRVDESSKGLDAGAGNGPRLLLADHHREIEAACRALLACTYADDPFQLIAQYRAFEHAVLDHLAAEEEVILPGYAEAAPAGARAIRADHAALRQQLLAVGVEVELHFVRAETVCRLIDQLNAHAAREDASMYPWAQLHLPLPAKRRLFVRIGRSLRALARRADVPQGA